MRKYVIIILAGIFFLFFAAGAGSSGSSSKSIEKWEYKVVLYTTLLDIKSADEAIKQGIGTNLLMDSNFEKAKERNLKIQSSLNELGSEGWELVYIDKSYLYFFKRKIN